MTVSELPEELRRFIQSNVPTYVAAELLLFLAQHPDKQWTPDEIVNEIKPSVITFSAVKEYLALFVAQGLVVEIPGARYQYQTASPEVKAAVNALAKAYNERPVTLIRTIYDLAKSKIQSFADAFKLKKD